MQRGGVPGVQSFRTFLKKKRNPLFMTVYFPRKPLSTFSVTSTSLVGHPTLQAQTSDSLYQLENPESEAWRYFQFRLLPDLGDVGERGKRIVHTPFFLGKRVHGEDFSALFLGVWTGVFPQPLQVALFHAASTSYLLHFRERTPLDMALDFGGAVARSYVTLHCPEHLERLEDYLKTS